MVDLVDEKFLQCWIFVLCYCISGLEVCVTIRCLCLAGKNVQIVGGIHTLLILL